MHKDILGNFYTTYRLPLSVNMSHEWLFFYIFSGQSYFIFSMYKKQGHYNPKIRVMKINDKNDPYRAVQWVGMWPSERATSRGCQSLVSLGDDRRIVLLWSTSLKIWPVRSLAGIWSRQWFWCNPAVAFLLSVRPVFWRWLLQLVPCLHEWL